jgi:phosphoheptose isomerase
MDYYQIIANNFQRSIETIAMSVDTLAGTIEQGSQLMANALLHDHKIIVCGSGVDAAVAQLFTCNLLNRFEEDRPALPALTLSADGASMTAIAQSSGINDIFSRQLRALGQAGDVLLCINSSSSAYNMLQAVQVAQERNMGVIVMSNAGDNDISSLLRTEDIELRVDSKRQASIVEIHTMAIHAFCELIDHVLFGSYNPE